jgi:hypothetical protein
MKIANSSDWSEAQIASFLTETTIPIRLAVQDGDYPTICSVWYAYSASQTAIYCVSHQSSYLVKRLRETGRCGFEVAPNDPPYRGVRGKALVEIQDIDAEELLTGLIERYLGSTDSKLANWLLGRIAEEVVIELKPTWLTAWDYSGRM